MSTPVAPTLAVLLLLIAGAGSAEPSDVIRLSPAEIARIQAEAESAAPLARDAQPRNRIHGEVGMTIGTGGARELYGVGDLQFGEDVRGAVAVGLDRWPRQRPVRRNRDRY